VPRIRAILEKEEVSATFFYPAVSAMLYPDEVRGIAAEGHEIGIHSWIHERNNLLPHQKERELSLRAAEKLSEISRRDPVGMRTAS
jgi:peptidoglycan/xylan/chitin deacetylase (PgdA/CDA1 family)